MAKALNIGRCSARIAKIQLEQQKAVVCKSVKKLRSEAQIPMPKSILGKGILRGRSKSVSFDLRTCDKDSEGEDFMARRGSARSKPLSDFSLGASNTSNEHPPVHSANSHSDEIDFTSTYILPLPVSPSYDIVSCNPGLLAGVAKEVAIVTNAHSDATDLSTTHTNVSTLPVALSCVSANFATHSSTDFVQDVPMDLSEKDASVPFQETGSTDDQVCGSENNINKNPTIEPVSSNKLIRDLMSRIADLTESNRTKINRIKLLLSEKNTFISEIDTLHRLNRSLVETLDMYRAEETSNRQPANDDRFVEMDSQIGELKHEVHSLRERIDRMNRSNIELENENKRLKEILRTHATQILGEHNYKM